MYFTSNAIKKYISLYVDQEIQTGNTKLKEIMAQAATIHIYAFEKSFLHYYKRKYIMRKTNLLVEKAFLSNSHSGDTIITLHEIAKFQLFKKIINIDNYDFIRFLHTQIRKL